MTHDLGPYKVDLVHKLGSGTFGTVYKATKGSQVFAVKRFNKDGSIDPNKIQQEIAAMKKLNGHEFVISVYEVYSQHSGQWVVMEFGDLGDLQGYLDKHSLDVQEKTRFMYHIASALSHIHSNNIVHRDLKPQNIILKQQGGRPVAKVTDFGEAKLFEGMAEGGRMNKLMNTIVGTQFFWAPELCEAYDRACREGELVMRYKASVDVFASGLIFLVILQNGGYPLSEQGHKDHKAKRMSNIVPIGREMLRRKKPVVVKTEKKDSAELKELKSLIVKMTCENPGRRSDVSEVISKLRPLNPDLAVRAPPPPPVEDAKPHVLVAAIDFGTTFSGYGFSFTSNQDNILMNKDWDDKPGFSSYKVPTSVLTDKAGNFVNFGFAAEKEYAEDDNNQYELFRHFKMMLHKKGISEHTTITSVAGYSHRAVNIFAMALRYLKDNIINNIKTRKEETMGGGLRLEQLIRWVITVPAIWTEDAKQFMRTAALKGGLIKSKESKQLLIALEPEAASFWCRGISTSFEVGKPVQFKPGDVYMIIDAGGGTVDITTHEVLAGGDIKEIHAANGDAMGGTKVDQNIERLLEEMLGETFLQTFQAEHPQAWFRLMNEMEVKKKSAHPSKGRFTVAVDALLGSSYEKFTGKSIVDLGKDADLGYKFSNGVLDIAPHKVEALFVPVVDKIVDHVAVQLQKPSLAKCKHLIVVGGFGECSFLQRAIQEKFGRTHTIMVPTEAETTVTKGAVLFGHNPLIVRGRIALMTYGTYSTPQFDPNKHDPKFKIAEDGKDLCNRVFNSFIEKGESVTTGTTIERYFCPNSVNQRKMFFNLYCLDRATGPDKIEYVESPEFQKLGDIVMDLPAKHAGPNTVIGLDITFGGTEITVQAKDLNTDAAAAKATTINFVAK